MSDTTTGGAIVPAQPTQSKALTKPTTVKGWIESPDFRAQVARALPRHLTPDRFLRVALTALLRTPKLAACEAASVTQCLLQCSQLGLEPDGRRAHLIPFEDRKNSRVICTLIIDYKGLVELAMRSGLVSTIHADVVRDGDVFAFNLGEISAHVPHFLRRDDEKPDAAGAVFAVYALARMKDGATACAVMSRDEVLSIRDNSQGWGAFKKGYAKQSPWDPSNPVSEQEMFKKTALRRLTKLLTLSPEFRDAVEADDEPAPVDVTPKVATPIFRSTSERHDAIMTPAAAPQDDGDVAPVAPEATKEPAPAPVVEAEVVPMPQAAPAASATTPQGELAEFVTGAGHTFDEFQAWARHQRFYSDELTGFDEVPGDVAKRLNKAKSGVLKSIASHNGGAR